MRNLDALGWSDSQTVKDWRPLIDFVNTAEVVVTGSQVSDLNPLLIFRNIQGLVVGTNGDNRSQLHYQLRWLQRVDTLRGNNNIRDFSAIGRLDRLTSLALCSERLSDVSLVSGLRDLRSLRIVNSNVADVSPISALSKLEQLHLRGCPVSDLAPITGLKKLFELEVESPRLRDCTPVFNMTRMSRLTFERCPITSLEGIGKLTGLSELKVLKCPVSDIAPLKPLQKLFEVNLSGSPIRSVSAFSGHPWLHRLYINYTNVSDLSPLSSVERLKSLGCVGAPVGGWQLARLRETHPNLEITHEEKRTPPPPQAPKSQCFVATFAFEDAQAPEVVTLRRYRDIVLERTRIGRLFVRIYYTVGPTVVRALRPWPLIRSPLRRGLRFFVRYAEHALGVASRDARSA